MQFRVLFILLFSLQVFSLSGQVKSNLIEAIDIEKTITTLFEGMLSADSSKVHSVFYDSVRMMSSFTTADGNEKLREGSLDGFLKAVGTPHDQIWNEKISNLVIQVDDNLAHAWMDYSFYLGEKFSHCGVNAMQLVKMNGAWKIIHLIDTRRNTNCAD